MTTAVDKSERRIRRMFGEISPKYDFLNHFLSGGTDRYWRWRTIRAVPPVGTAPILDVCTGTGDLAIAYWKKGNRNVPVVGADFTHEMLVRAEKKGNAITRRRKAEPLAPLSFLEADAQRLPFADDSFQIVSVAFGLRNVTDTKQGLREMVRVCRSGGRIVILEFSLPRLQPFRFVYGLYFRHVLPRIGQLLARNRHGAYRYLPASVGEFPSGEALAERVRAAGASQVRYFPLTLGVATLYVGTK